MRLRERAVFRATPERVWDVLADWERQASWMPDVAWMRLMGDERELGARLEVRTKVLGIPATTDVIKVMVWEPPRRLGIVHEGLVRGRGAWLLDPSDGGTRFTWIEELRMRPPFLGGAALEVYRPVQAAMMRRSVRNLGRLAEAGG
jgi:carbon monoxide dehydrogenase subunit G